MAFTAGSIVTADDLNAPIASLRQTTPQAIANNTFTTLTFNVEDLDTANGHSTTVNTSRYTAQRAGRYMLLGGVSFAGNSTGARGGNWLKNGSNIPRGQCMYQAATAPVASQIATRTAFVTLAVGDYVELQAFQSSGASLNTSVFFTEESFVDIYYLN